MKKAEAQELLNDTTQLLDMWQQFRRAMDKAWLDNTEISREDESNFLATKSAMSKQLRSAAQSLPKELRFDANKMGDMLKQSLSIQHFRGIPEVEIPQMRSDWHVVWVNLTRAVGGMAYLAAGGKPAHRKVVGPPVKGKRGKTKKKGMMQKIIILAVILAALGGAAIFFGWI